MATETKKKLLVGWLVLFAIWPAVHAGLVIRYDISPWKLFGWAMYVTPILPATVRLSAPGGEEDVSIPPGVLSDASREALDDFRDQRLMLGDLVAPDELGAALLEQLPQFPQITVSLQKMRIRSESDTVVIDIRRYVYHR